MLPECLNDKGIMGYETLAGTRAELVKLMITLYTVYGDPLITATTQGKSYTIRQTVQLIWPLKQSAGSKVHSLYNRVCY